MPERRTPRTPKKKRDWKPVWLTAFAETGMVSAACREAKVGRSTVYDARIDEEFARSWDEIEHETTDQMECEAYRRAVKGVTKPLVSAGRRVCDVQEYSDTLLIFMLKARKPKVYRDNVRVEHTGPDGGPVLIASPPDALDRSRRAAELLRGAGALTAGNGNGNGSNGHH